MRLASFQIDNTVLCALLLLFVSAYIGFIGEGGMLFPSMATYGILTSATSAVLYALFLNQHRTCRHRTAQATPALLDERQSRLALAVSLLLNFAVAWVNRPEFRPWLLICNTLLLGLLLQRKPMPNLAFALVLLAGIGMRCIANHNAAFGGTDMLPLVQSGLNAFLAGENPYRPHMMHMSFGAYPLDMTYLPLMWLSYLPAHLLGIDLRWTNVGADAVSALLLWAAFGNIRNRSFRPALLASVWLLNPYFAHRMDTEIAIFCLIASLCVYAMSTGRFWLLAIASGLMLATMQLALIILPFALFHMVARIGWKRSSAYLAIALVIAALLIRPFDGNAMLKGVLGHWGPLYSASFEWARKAVVNFNFAVFFYYLQKQYLLVPIQMLICLATFTLFMISRGKESCANTLNFSALTLLLFLQFNILVWTYLFAPVFILWSWSIALSGTGNQKAIQDPP